MRRFLPLVVHELLDATLEKKAKALDIATRHDDPLTYTLTSPLAVMRVWINQLIGRVSRPIFNDKDSWRRAVFFGMKFILKLADENVGIENENRSVCVSGLDRSEREKKKTIRLNYLNGLHIIDSVSGRDWNWKFAFFSLPLSAAAAAGSERKNRTENVNITKRRDFNFINNRRRWDWSLRLEFVIRPV